jgi:hypothetical protein
MNTNKKNHQFIMNPPQQVLTKSSSSIEQQQQKIVSKSPSSTILNQQQQPNEINYKSNQQQQQQIINTPSFFNPLDYYQLFQQQQQVNQNQLLFPLPTTSNYPIPSPTPPNNKQQQQHNNPSPSPKILNNTTPATTPATTTTTTLKHSNNRDYQQVFNYPTNAYETSSNEIFDSLAIKHKYEPQISMTPLTPITPTAKFVQTHNKRATTPKQMAKDIASQQMQQQQQQHYQQQLQFQQLLQIQNQTQLPQQQNLEKPQNPYLILENDLRTLANANPLDFRLTDYQQLNPLLMARTYQDSYAQQQHAQEYLNQVMSSYSFDRSGIPLLQNSNLPYGFSQPATPSSSSSSYEFTHHDIGDLCRMLWTGMFTLKNDSVSVSMSFVCGNQDIAKSCLNQMSIELTSTNTSLKILQRMRLEQSQLEGVKKKLQVN